MTTRNHRCTRRQQQQQKPEFNLRAKTQIVSDFPLLRFFRNEIFSLMYVFYVFSVRTPCELHSFFFHFLRFVFHLPELRSFSFTFDSTETRKKQKGNTKNVYLHTYASTQHSHTVSCARLHMITLHLIPKKARPKRIKQSYIAYNDDAV